MSLRLNVLRCALAAALSASSSIATAAGIYSQMVLPFPTERKVDLTYVKSENALILAFQKTSPDELGPLDSYDERLVKRVIIKDLGPVGTEVKLVLRDRNVRAIVNKFQEPFRVAVDIFEASYNEDKDPTTGMPLVGNPAAAPEASPGKLMVEDGTPIEAAPAAVPSSGANGNGKLKLLNPMPKVFESSADMTAAMKSAAPGVGKSWKTFPPYVFRLQTAAYEEGADKPVKNPGAEALSSSRAMADYAGKLFNLGHEAQALVAYNQVLHLEPSLFDRDALHLWKFAEVHLGQGNTTLARGYYEALIEKHPDSPLAAFARLRLLDGAAIRLLQNDDYAQLPSLIPQLDTIRARTNGELSAQIALRRAYWDKAGQTPAYSPSAIPRISPAVRADLAAAFPNAENSKTALLTANILLADMLSPEAPWLRTTGPFAQAYFKRFSGEATEPWRTNLRDMLSARLNGNLQKKVSDGKLTSAIDDYEAVPKDLKALGKTTATAWSLAEAYRKMGQPEKAVDLYLAASKGETDGQGRVKAEFWLAVTAGELAAALHKSSPTKAESLAKMSRDADKKLDASWKRLKPEEQKALAVAYKDAFESAVNGNAKLRTPPKIVLSLWTQALGTKASATTGVKTDWERSFSPSGGAVMLMTDLGKRFGELGLTAERREALALLKAMKPKDFEDDKAAKDIWARQLLKLAEDYRNAGDYLEAGRLFSLVGADAENWEGRAEALYKGGLLLFRAGRRAEALDAFKKSSEDGNNLFYSNLAKERLSQIQ